MITGFSGRNTTATKGRSCNAKRFANLLVFCASLLVSLSAPAAPSERRVQIITPFPPSFVEAFRSAFCKRHPDIAVEFVQRKTAAAVGDILAQKRPDADIFWASAPDAFELLKRANLLARLNSRATGAPREIAGYPVNDPDLRYLGFAVSGYGLVFNPSYLNAHVLPVPKNWSDLAAPVYAGHVGLTSPARSGTTHLMVEALLQSLGWESGWAMWSEIGGNLTTITARSFGVIAGVDRGRFGIGASIDFLSEAKAIEGDDNRFVLPLPPLFAPASIARLVTSQNPAEAELFIDFILSQEGQAMLREPQIGRLAISPSAYGIDEKPAHLSREGAADTIPIFNAGLSASRYDLVNLIFDEWITFRRAEHAKLWRDLHAMEAALSIYRDKNLTYLLISARAALTKAPVSAAELQGSAGLIGFTRAARGVPPTPVQMHIETSIRQAVRIAAEEAGGTLVKAAERLGELGWNGRNVSRPQQ